MMIPQAKHRAVHVLKRLHSRQRELARRQTAVGVSLETTVERRLALKVFAFEDGSQPYGFHGTFKRMLAAAGLNKDMSSGQERTLYSLRHTYATLELLSGTDMHTVARQMGTSVGMLERHYSKLTAMSASTRCASNWLCTMR